MKDKIEYIIKSASGIGKNDYSQWLISIKNGLGEEKDKPIAMTVMYGRDGRKWAEEIAKMLNEYQ